jgi:hypothetical protein
MLEGVKGFFKRRATQILLAFVGGVAAGYAATKIKKRADSGETELDNNEYEDEIIDAEF